MIRSFYFLPQALTVATFLAMANPSFGQSFTEDWSGSLSESFCNAPDLSTWCRFDLNFNLDADGNPTGPKTWGPGTFSTTSGDLHLGTTGPVPILDPPLPEPKDPLFFDFADSGVLGLAWGPSFVDPSYGDGFVRSRVMIGANSTAGFGFRFDLSQFAGYVFSVSDVRGFEFTENEPFNSVQVQTIPGIDPEPGEWWWMEGGGVGDQLSFKVWKEGDEEPFAPQLLITDDTYSAGAVGPAAYVQTGFIPVASKVDVTWDSFSFQHVPEPANSITLVVTILGIWHLRRRIARLHREVDCGT